jgi:hypothetical protein
MYGVEGGAPHAVERGAVGGLDGGYIESST